MRPPANDHHPTPDIAKTHDAPRQSGRDPVPTRAKHDVSGAAYSKRDANRRICLRILPPSRTPPAQPTATRSSTPPPVNRAGPAPRPLRPKAIAAAVREPRPNPRPGGRHRNENDRFRRLRRRHHHPHSPGAPARRRSSPLPGVAKDARRLAPGRPGPLPSRANRDAGGSAYSKRAAKRRELATYSSTILNTTCAADCGSFIDPTTCPT